MLLSADGIGNVSSSSATNRQVRGRGYLLAAFASFVYEAAVSAQRDNSGAKRGGRERRSRIRKMGDPTSPPSSQGSCQCSHSIFENGSLRRSFLSGHRSYMTTASQSQTLPDNPLDISTVLSVISAGDRRKAREAQKQLYQRRTNLAVDDYLALIIALKNAKLYAYAVMWFESMLAVGLRPSLAIFQEILHIAHLRRDPSLTAHVRQQMTAHCEGGDRESTTGRLFSSETPSTLRLQRELGDGLLSRAQVSEKESKELNTGGGNPSDRDREEDKDTSSKTSGSPKGEKEAGTSTRIGGEGVPRRSNLRPGSDNPRTNTPSLRINQSPPFDTDERNDGGARGKIGANLSHSTPIDASSQEASSPSITNHHVSHPVTHKQRPTVTEYTRQILELSLRMRLTEALRLFQQARHEGHTMPVPVYTELIWKLSFLTKSEEAYSLYAHIRTLRPHLTPPPSIYNSLVHCATETRDARRLEWLFDDMKRVGAQVTLEMYTSLVSTYFHIGEAEKALEMFRWVEREKRMRPDEVLYSVMLVGFAREGACQDLDRMAEWYEAMVMDGFTPSLSVYTFMMGAYGRNGRLKGAEFCMEQLRSAKVRMDSICYNTMIAACATAGNPELAEEYCRRMWVEGGFRPDVYTYGALINAYVKVRDWGRAGRAYRELVAEYERVEKEGGGDGGIDGGTEGGEDRDSATIDNIPEPSATRPLSNVLSKTSLMKELELDQYRPTPHVFHTIINGLVKGGHIEEAKTYLREMASYHIKRFAHLAVTLIWAFGKVGDVEGAVECWRGMRGAAAAGGGAERNGQKGKSQKTGTGSVEFTPHVYTVVLRAVVKGHETGAVSREWVAEILEEVLSDMKMCKIKMDARAWAECMQCYAICGRVDVVMEMYGELFGVVEREFAGGDGGGVSGRHDGVGRKGEILGFGVKAFLRAGGEEVVRGGGGEERRRRWGRRVAGECVRLGEMGVRLEYGVWKSLMVCLMEFGGVEVAAECFDRMVRIWVRCLDGVGRSGGGDGGAVSELSEQTQDPNPPTISEAHPLLAILKHDKLHLARTKIEHNARAWVDGMHFQDLVYGLQRGGHVVALGMVKSAVGRLSSVLGEHVTLYARSLLARVGKREGGGSHADVGKKAGERRRKGGREGAEAKSVDAQQRKKADGWNKLQPWSKPGGGR
ncbi:hypothetical protein HDV00_010199 [Rhizophlyctis rosea]|nr:hypothetical protein HDV00_010199 [Rhizophlyctis rosea]